MIDSSPLCLPAADCRILLALQGPSLALWRAAEIAALRTQRYAHPLLDLGCGDGIVSSLVFPVVDIGVDPDPGALDSAGQRGTYCRRICSPAETMPVPDGTIATVVSNSVLEHLTDLDGVLQAVSRVLQPSGIFTFTTPTPEFGSWLFLPARSYGAWRNRALVHRSLLDASQWSSRLAAHGLAVESVRYYLRRSLVWAWDALELLQQVWLGRRRLASLIWKRLPESAVQRIAAAYAATDFSAGMRGGGQMITARKV